MGPRRGAREDENAGGTGRVPAVGMATERQGFVPRLGRWPGFPPMHSGASLRRRRRGVPPGARRLRGCASAAFGGGRCRWAGASRSRSFLALLLGASHFLGLFPRLVDAVSGAPSRYDLSGTVRVSDGDTLRMGRVRIRLSAIDAVEKSQTCVMKASGKRTPCGASASAALSEITGGREVRCLSEGRDRYGRTLGQCWVRIGAEDVDIGRHMVRQGWAIAYRRYSNRYALDEAEARVEGVGLWAMEFEVPEEYRREKVAMR